MGMMKMLPNMVVVHPCDFNQTRAATLAVASHMGPVYLRFGRPKVPNFTDPSEDFVIGRAQMLIPGEDVSIFATGHMVWHALEASKKLSENGIHAEVINMHTIKPLDEKAVISSARKTRCIVTAEEHQRNGGLGESIAGVMARHHPVPMEMVAVNDVFGQSGKPEELLRHYGLDMENIVAAVQKVILRK
jgi:transketolase